MVHLPIAALAIIIVSTLAGGYMLISTAHKPRCVICHKALPKVCPGGQCADLPKPKPIDPAEPARALSAVIGPRPESGPAQRRWDEAKEFLDSVARDRRIAN